MRAVQLSFYQEHRGHSKLWKVIRAFIFLTIWAWMIPIPIIGLYLYGKWRTRVPIIEFQAQFKGNKRSSKASERFEALILSRNGLILGELGSWRGFKETLTEGWTPYASISWRLTASFLAVEDHRFFQHRGIDVKGVLRALIRDIEACKIVEGGSTITQQLAKQYVGNEKSFHRKIKEAILARKLEAKYSKEEILEAYLNQIYLGYGVKGITQASWKYFKHSPKQMTWAEGALLAGLAKAPSWYDPLRHPERAKLRRQEVLERLLELRWITPQMYEAANRAPLIVSIAESRSPKSDRSIKRAPYFRTRVLREIEKQLGPKPKGKWIIHTTVDLKLEAKALDTLDKAAQKLAHQRGEGIKVWTHLSKWKRMIFAVLTCKDFWRSLKGHWVLGMVVQSEEKGIRLSYGCRDLGWMAYQGKTKLGDLIPIQVFKKPKGELQYALRYTTEIQGAWVSIDLGKSSILSAVGGTNFQQSQFHRVFQSCRPPGSTIKPLIYELALRLGWQLNEVVMDAPQKLRDSRGHFLWSPRNGDRDYRGAMTLAQALIHSRNIPTILLARALGFSSIIREGKRLNLESMKWKAVDALALGAICVRFIDLMRFYGILARRGRDWNPKIIEWMEELGAQEFRDFSTVLEAPHSLRRWIEKLKVPKPSRRLDSKIAYQITVLLREVVKQGTAKGIPWSFAGKTGTTGAYDIWFIGFDKRFIHGIWFGEDKNKVFLGKVSASKEALEPWKEIVSWTIGYLEGVVEDPTDEIPQGIRFHWIDRKTGKLLDDRSEKTRHRRGDYLPFWVGREPRLHEPSEILKMLQKVDFYQRKF